MILDRRHFLAATGVGAIAAAMPAAALARSHQTSAATLLDALAEEYLRLSPESATSLGIDTGPRAALRAATGDRGPEGRRANIAWLRSAVERLDLLDTAGMDADTRTHVEVARTAYATALDGFAFPYGAVAIGGWRNGPYAVAQNMGSYLDTPKFLDSGHPLETAADADAYLERMTAFAANLDGETERLRGARGRGVVASDVVMDKALSAIRMTRAEPVPQWLLVNSLADRAAAIPGNWRRRAETIAAERIVPALDRQIAELAEHRKVATTDIGVWKFGDGADYYAWALRAATTTRMTPDEVHDNGLAQLADLHGQMDVILKSLGSSDGSVGTRMLALARDPRYAFAEGDKGRAEIMAFIQQRLADIRPRLPRAFHTLVRGNVEVRRIAPAEEAGAPGAYGGAGSIDGSVPGRFWINLRSTAMHQRYSLPTLTYHEAIPGHVWQGEYSFRLPLIRTLMGFSAFSEGWALYAEQLADELGVYERDAVGRLGYLDSMAFRAARMVVDTGIHHKRWNRDKALAWFAEATGQTVDGVASEVDRYCVWPGQACAYKVGHSDINRQRRRAQEMLGDRFDYRGFNDLVVAGGGRPLTVVEASVDRWVAGLKG
ncbi:DUF885 domain-containing protein [Sphingomonas sp.]